MLQNALLRITRSSHSLSTTYLGHLHSGLMNELFKPCERLKLPAGIRNTATERNREIIIWLWLVADITRALIG